MPPPAPDPVILTVTKGSITRVLTWIRRLLGWATFAYAGWLILMLVALEWWGERNWLLSIFLYAPPQILLLPLAALTPLCLLFRWRLLVWHLVAVAILFFGYMTFRWTPRAVPTSAAITAVTFNAGESNRPQFHEFIAQEKPDIIILQDARSRGPELARKLLDKSVIHLGRFTFISRYPLEKMSYVEGAKWQGQPIAARCETVIAGRATALYSIHLPTPRQQLSRFLGGRRILGDLVGKKSREAGFGDYREWLSARIELARNLAGVLAQEPLPMIVGGDFNTPDHGYIHRLFSNQMTDAFAHAGRGWGLTFPGSTRNPVTFFGPWLRLDYFFVGRGWEVIECRPEPGGKSQHKAVLARIEPRPQP
jgi:endonuclease/exonuclease/phosphatase (EEP) superfamily protein YafD